jgi:formylglycine-generating enzyme required for sulfatase activity
MGKLVSARKLIVVDRSNLELIQEEMNFQLSGEVSDESAQAIGKKLGAQYIITGSFTGLGGTYRFRVYALNVESAARETATMVTVRNDSTLSFLLYGNPALSAVVPQTLAVPLPAAAPPAKPVEQPPQAQEMAGGFVRVPGGTFMMGSPGGEPNHQDDETLHQVTVSAFLISKYEVNQEDYERVMSANPSYAKGKNLPVEMVSWDDAIEYCNRLSEKEGLTPVYSRSGDSVIWNLKASGYRLPTEAEWEYACRAGTSSTFSTGDNITTHEANYNGNRPYNGNAKGSYMQTTMPVGSYPPNPWGLYDMHGNVCEWCWDWYAEYGTASQTNPQGASGGRRGRVARGGGYREAGADQRSAVRFYGEPSYRLNDLGFRIVKQTP